MRTMIFYLLLLAPFFAGTAYAAGPFEEILRTVEKASWGTPQSAVRAGMQQTPLLENQEIIILPAGVSGRDATMNYLFSPGGELYNLAWYTVFPVAEIDAARSLAADMETALREKYGAPIKSFTDGDANKARDVAQTASQKEEERRAVLQEIKAKKDQGDEKGALQLTARLFMMMPTIFFSRLEMWDGGDIWAYTILLCSTDGTCHLHLQFVSKAMTQDENYAATPEKLFSYSPADRDQDLVAKHNAALGAKKEQAAP